jgi:hypothetical protein
MGWWQWGLTREGNEGNFWRGFGNINVFILMGVSVLQRYAFVIQDECIS